VRKAYSLCAVVLARVCERYHDRQIRLGRRRHIVLHYAALDQFRCSTSAKLVASRQVQPLNYPGPAGLAIKLNSPSTTSPAKARVSISDYSLENQSYNERMTLCERGTVRVGRCAPGSRIRQGRRKAV